MGKVLVKFIVSCSRTTDASHQHWEYCRNNKIPRIFVIPSGIKYWEIDFDILPINKSVRFTTSDCESCIEPLYNHYCKNAKLPVNKSSFGNFSFRVYKDDAPGIAEKLFVTKR